MIKVFWIIRTIYECMLGRLGINILHILVGACLMIEVTWLQRQYRKEAYFDRNDLI